MVTRIRRVTYWRFTPVMVWIFADRASEVYRIATTGIRIYSVAYLCYGTNVFASSFFTALSNGRISALISVLRTLVFLLSGVVVLSVLLGAMGVWMAGPFAEIATILFSLWFFRRNGARYGYLPAKS